MPLEKTPFRTYNDEDDFDEKIKKREIITLSLNTEELKELTQDMNALQQSKQSTALKQMWQIARYVLHRSEMGQISRILYENVRRNVRTGINEVMLSEKQM